MSKMMNDGLFSSDRIDWETPPEFFALIDSEFHFDLDVCALPRNKKTPRCYTPEEDGLEQDWHGTCWMNPPYGKEIVYWVRKAYESAKQGTTVVALVPARVDSRWWHEYCMKASEVRFVERRLKFVGATAPAPFPCALVVFRPGDNTPKFSAQKRA
jgi:phage N-6-adenine-methyltransferase